MSKIDLKKASGLSIYFDGESLTSPDMQISEVLNVTVDDIRDHLLNKDLTSPEIFYTKYLGIDQDSVYSKKKLKVNLYIIPPNLAGIEYIKTKASRISKYPRILEVLHGGGSILMQNFNENYDGDIIFSTLKKSQKAIVPAGYAISIVNTRSFPLCILEVVCNGSEETYELDDMGGMSYYVIRKNAKQEIVRNPTYKFAKSPRKVNWDVLCTKIGITVKTPLIKQILRKYEKFKWLFKEDSITI